MIPKIFHVIWIGDESRRPDNCIETWQRLNPGWALRVWGNRDLTETGWNNAAHMREMAKRELNGVADMMRWEILYHHGGVAVDADSYCVRRLDDWLQDFDAVSCWENELVRPGLIATSYLGFRPKDPLLSRIVNDIRNEPSVTDRMAWESVGPARLTEAYRKYRYQQLTVLPSHFFIPRHHTGLEYQGSGPIYARQIWASTFQRYDSLYLESLDGADRPRTD